MGNQRDTQRDRTLTNLHRIFARQDFKSDQEAQNFLDKITEQPLVPTEELTLVEQAEDLIFDAWEFPEPEAKVEIKNALRLNPDCIEAYELLSCMEEEPAPAMKYLETGISIGRRIFGGQYLEKNKGIFWRLHETRPFMRCLYAYSTYLFLSKKMKESAALLEEMITLNPNDDQGARDQLLLFLIALDETEKFLKYDKFYKDTGYAYPLFNRALFTFKTEGESKNANQKLETALKQNKFVAPLMLSNELSRIVLNGYALGSEKEAEDYVSYAQFIWPYVKGSEEWLKKVSTKK